MVTLAQIKEQFRLSLGSYGRPHITDELKEMTLNIGHRRVVRLMPEIGIRVERSKKYKVTTFAHPFQVSMSGKGSCYDNSTLETFFETIKAELIWRRSWQAHKEAEMGIFQHINGLSISDVDTQHGAVAFERKVV